MAKKSNMNKKTLDIVVTDYFPNYDWIKELVASVQNLDCNYRIIRISDTDMGPSATLLNSLPGTRYIYAPAGDRGTSKQIGLDNASSDYIMFLDNADYLITSDLNKYLNLDVDVIRLKNSEQKISEMISHFIFKRELIEKYNLKFICGQNFFEDFLIVSRLLERINNGDIKQTITAEPVYYYRHNSSDIVNSTQNDYKYNCLCIIDEILREEPDYETYKSNLKNIKAIYKPQDFMLAKPSKIKTIGKAAFNKLTKGGMINGNN